MSNKSHTSTALFYLYIYIYVCQIWRVGHIIHYVSPAVYVKSDPFGGDPFKGSDPFAADTFFTQTSSTPFSSEDPFSASADPFGTTSGVPEPDLFAAKVNDTAAVPAGPDPFASKSTNPAAASNDPFSSKGNNTADSDPFGGKMTSTKEADPFGSQDGDKDPFSSSPPSSDLAVVSRPANKTCLQCVE